MRKGCSCMSNLCIIPARGGSKRIPRKNIRDFCGKPIIAYSIEAALKSEIFDEVMVSTEDEEIAEVARKHGASVPFMRSAETASDFAITANVLDEVLQKYDELGQNFKVMSCLYSTSPLVTADELRQASKVLDNKGTDSVVAVTDFDFPPQRAFLLSEDGHVAWERPEFAKTRSQDLPKTAHDCGRFYFIKTDAWAKHHTFVTPNCRGFHIDSSLVQDIDTESDWHMAELKYRLLTEQK